MQLGVSRSPDYYHKRQRRRRVWTLVGAALIFALIIVIGVLVYTWYTGKQQAVVEEVTPVVVQSTPFAEAPKPAEDTPVSIAPQVVLSPVKLGNNTSVSIKTLPMAACSIKFTYNDDKISRDSGLVPKTADEFGLVEWTWKVTEDTRPGIWPVEITCALDKRSAYSKSDITVQP